MVEYTERQFVAVYIFTYMVNNNSKCRKICFKYLNNKMQQQMYCLDMVMLTNNEGMQWSKDLTDPFAKGSVTAG
jgi:hypothetical protein